MELREFAERLLRTTSLEEKLLPPGEITDECPGPAIAAPDQPGRPAALRFRGEGVSRPDFPGLHRLEQERERGRLLHFFANHELLATELMALVLLRFPDAPPAFRRGVLRTLQDEQEHTRLYMRRMQECGLAFGELPVSGHIWRCLAPMENPIDYVAGLCLTFEQANLDFARQFARSFGQIGDAPTAALLERIYHDEIGHVAYGLKWFRRWKNPDESDWSAFCRTLQFPLSPQRAKGITFNVEGRQAAGLDPEFIAELEVFAQSRGRTPSVFVFNPFAEGFVARGLAFTPGKHQTQLARDLANLPQFLGRKDDIVLVPERPSIEFLRTIKEAGFPLPEFVEMPSTQERGQFCPPPPTMDSRPPASELAGRKIGRLRPWAWGPDSLKLLEPFFSQITGEPHRDFHQFQARMAPLYSKAWSAKFLGKCLTDISDWRLAIGDLPAGTPPSPFSRLRPGLRRASRSPLSALPSPLSALPSPLSLLPSAFSLLHSEAGVAVSNLDDALAAIATIRKRGHHRIVVKEAIGLAGSNSLRLWEPELLASQRAWMERALANGQELVVEPWLERALDFSIQLEMQPDGLKVVGYTGLINDHRGQFQANWAAADHARRLPAALIPLFPEVRDIQGVFRRLYQAIFTSLETELRALDYVGPLGIDAFVYRDATGACRLKPIVEINPRYTMGRLTLELMHQAAPGCAGCFRIINRAMARSAGFKNFADYAGDLRARFPLQLAGQPVPRIHSGALCLNDPDRAEAVLATFQVGRNELLDQGGPHPQVR